MSRRFVWPPTDLDLLEAIYRRYYPEFEKFQKGDISRDNKIYVPIDCAEIAEKFGVDPDIVFGRLYYSLERRFGLQNSDGSSTPFFALQVGSDTRAIHFPMLASVLSEMRAERWRFTLGIWLSIAAIGISMVSLAISVV